MAITAISIDCPTVVALITSPSAVREGEIFGVLGPNGSGKSTLIRLIATLMLPDAGSITVFGNDVVRQSMQVQRMINRVSVEASFFKKLSPMENLIYGARLYGMEGGETRRQVVEILTRLGLEKRSIYAPMEEMSRGMQQKVAIARALLSRPKLLLLDEPTTGLDPRSKREVQAVVREMNEQQGTTILLTTHDMLEADSAMSPDRHRRERQGRRPGHAGWAEDAHPAQRARADAGRGLPGIDRQATGQGRRKVGRLLDIATTTTERKDENEHTNTTF